jgi:uncharacterized membrane protein
MNIPDHLLPAAWSWLFALLSAAVLVAGFRQGSLKALAEPWRLNLLLGACVGLIFLWSMATGVKPGLNFHVLGATALTLMFGWQLALLALAIVSVGVTVAGLAGWEALPANFVLMGALPVLVSQGIFRVVDRRLPNHFMIYVFVCAFFGAAVTMAVTGLGISLVMSLSGAYTWDYLATQYLPYFVLMGWSEAMLTGMGITLMAVYRPLWLATFDDERYLQNH